MKFLPVLLETLGLAFGSQDFGISVLGFGIWRLFAVVLLEGVVGRGWGDDAGGGSKDGGSSHGCCSGWSCMRGDAGLIMLRPRWFM